MFFKNLNAYRIIGDFDISEMNTTIGNHMFVPCEYGEVESTGWVSPIGDHYDVPVHSANGFHMFCLKEEKISVPASVINELVGNEITERLKKDTSIDIRYFTKKIRSAIKEEILNRLLTRGNAKYFSKSSRTYGYIDQKSKLLFVDTGSAKKAEEFALRLLRMINENGVKFIPVKTLHEPCRQMSNWITTEQFPSSILKGDSVKLREIDGNSSIKYSQHDIDDEKILAYLGEEKTVAEIKVNWLYNDNPGTYVSMVITEDFILKSVKFSKELASCESDSMQGEEVADYDVNFCLMTGIHKMLFDYILNCFGGESQVDEDGNDISFADATDTSISEVDEYPEVGNGSFPLDDDQLDE